MRVRFAPTQIIFNFFESECVYYGTSFVHFDVRIVHSFVCCPAWWIFAPAASYRSPESQQLL